MGMEGRLGWLERSLSDELSNPRHNPLVSALLKVAEIVALLIGSWGLGFVWVSFGGEVVRRIGNSRGGRLASVSIGLVSLLLVPAIVLAYAAKGYATGNNPVIVKPPENLSPSDLRFEAFADLMDNPLAATTFGARQ